MGHLAARAALASRAAAAIGPNILRWRASPRESARSSAALTEVAAASSREVW
jgi:hypothetical protein